MFECNRIIDENEFNIFLGCYRYRLPLGLEYILNIGKQSKQIQSCFYSASR